MGLKEAWAEQRQCRPPPPIGQAERGKSGMHTARRERTFCSMVTGTLSNPTAITTLQGVERPLKSDQRQEISRPKIGGVRQ
jgi:hypothetical protein